MSILSLTFHTPEDLCGAWEIFMKTELLQMVKNLMDVEKYMVSEVASDMIGEGKNTNLLLIFESDEKRTDFVQIELINITEIIETKFGQEVMMFETYLNPFSSRI